MRVWESFQSLCWRNENGSVSVEATLVLPVVIVLSLILMISAVYIFQHEWTYSSAAVTADRIAHTWDNSHKHRITGMYVPIQHDPLYWRLTDDGAENWFRPLDSLPTATVAFPASTEQESSLTIKKLTNGIAALSGYLAGSAAYSNQGWRRFVTVETLHPFHAPSMLGVRWGNRIAGSSTETVVDPAEYIRNIDLVRSYLLMIETKWEPGTIQNMLAPWLQINSNEKHKEGRPLQFAAHAEAVRYLRSLVRGRQARIDTEQTGSWRLVDALDGHGISHQAYLGAKRLNADMRNQLMKDVELIRNGKVKGVVWHFFRKTGSGAAGPDAALRKELEKHGIAIVVHT
ncbi:hypothetical protein [Paenibacillus alkalitolerans]|uniref:hypothetical protein n=1 Tax=Paenibacillus alkalitolerans TaxID=2799335 RepID=UPI0018F2CDB6|nr:hypothetical protein [Paenibacillus alkalitolerans]